LAGEGSHVLAEEQAALRRIATLVARGVPPEEVFVAVTEEVARLLPVSSAAMGRYDPDGMFTTVAAWSTGEAAFPVGRTTGSGEPTPARVRDWWGSAIESKHSAARSR
jgi:GAF domain-containing protein